MEMVEPARQSLMSDRAGDRVWDLARRFAKFLAVGVGGLVINMGGLYLLTTRTQLYYVLAAFIAIEISLFFTFALNELWTWGDRRFGQLFYRFLKYQAVNGMGLGINIVVLFLLTTFVHLHYLVSNLFGAATAALWNFGANHSFTWGVPRARRTNLD